ncbi:MAG: EAL domain-containing protein [Ruminococcus sp.]|uniref:EAL domain-containing protein n=1 Tax=Ruminococcus sp. TaxID=41978 RepID=UPI0025E5B579|nr:EAL domain-containing protein [Ruminococcus sp.]MBR5684301.1 EAL domain-containing protein [Ruminococcus sp.]
MFANTDLRLGTYMPVGDIIVLSLCLVMSILIRQTHIGKEKTGFHIIMHILSFAFVAAVANILFQTHMQKEELNIPYIYIIRIIHHVLFMLIMIFYIRYIQGCLWIPTKGNKKVRILIVVSVVLTVILDVLASYFKIGFYIDKDHDYNAGLDIFEVMYLIFMINIVYLLIKFRKRLLMKIFTGIVSVLVISNLLLVIQAFNKQISYTSICCFLPIVSIIFFFHSNPFSIDTGAVSGEFFAEEIKENLAKGNEMVIMCCHMPGFSSKITKSAELRTEFYEFFRNNVKKAILYSFPNDSFVMTIVKQKNTETDKLVSKMLDDFRKSHEIFNIDYKIIIMESSDIITNVSDYHNIIDYTDMKMPFNSIERVTPDDIKDYYDKHYILSELEDIAAKKDPFDRRVLVYCQPVYNLNTGQYDTAEALMRLKLDKTGMVFPDQFIPLAEQFNLIHNLSMIILNKTCFALRGLLNEGYIVKRISVNFSAIDLRYDSFCDEVKGIIERNGIEYGKIAVEITESRSDADFNLMKQRVIQLQDLGIKFYLDDFGTGYSNFERIMEIPFDIIKFDRSLLIESLKNASSQYMVKTFANMFHDLKYSILFEGVENEHDENRCKLMMAQYLQGYKYSKPIPIEELRKFLLHA